MDQKNCGGQPLKSLKGGGLYKGGGLTGFYGMINENQIICQ